jgi:serine/threonine-protein kinase
LRIGAQVAAALAAAHARGLVHRDIKPGNVMLGPSGAKVVDFGIAALAGDSAESAPDGLLWGTPAYLAPERLDGGEVLPASDVYALGILLFRLLTGETPWHTETVTQLIEAHRHSKPEDLPDDPEVPDEVRDLYRRCLAKRPADRPEAAEVARVLGAVGPADLSLAELSAEPDPDAETQIVSPRAPARRPKARRRGRVPLRVGAVLCLLTLVLFTGFCAASGHHDQTGGPPAAAANPPAPDPSDASGTPTATGSGGGAPGAAVAAGGAAQQPDPGTGQDGVPASAPDPAPDGGATSHPTGGPTATAGSTPPVAGPVLKPVDKTVSTVGGTVLVRCVGNTATLLGVHPAPGFAVAGLDSGPGDTVGVVLRSPLTTVHVGARCQNGEPVPTVSIG